jgi:hypothetical protein
MSGRREVAALIRDARSCAIERRRKADDPCEAA